MGGFINDTFSFLSDLARNNSKDWFEANRRRYEEHWRAPAIEFIEIISERMSELDPPLKAEPRLNGSLRRINRDVRFSRDKTPYNPSLHLIFWAGEHPNRSPGAHLVLQPQGVGYGAGLYGLTPEKIKGLRDAIVDPVESKALFKALDIAEADGNTLGKPDLARIPKGYEGEGRAGDLLRYKSLVVRTHGKLAPPKSIVGGQGIDWAIKRVDAVLPLIRWLSIL